MGKLTIVRRVDTLPTNNVMMSQVRLLCDSTKLLGVVFSLIGVVFIVLAWDRLTFSNNPTGWPCILIA